jgi:hypothetical protein
MSDEIEAIKRSDVAFKLTALEVHANRAGAMARALRVSGGSSRPIAFFPVIYFCLLAAMGLWFIWLFGAAWNNPSWGAFWIAVLAALVWIPIFGRLASRRDATPQPAVYLHRGIQALRQAAAAGDNRLAPVVQNRSDEFPDIHTENTVTGRFQRVHATTNAIVSWVMGVALIALAVLLITFDRTLLPGLDSTLHTIYIGAVAVMLIEGVYVILLGFQTSRPFEISADTQGIRWQRPSGGLRRRLTRSPWQDVRSFVTIHVSKDGKTDANIDEIYLLDTMKYAVAWKITPKTPASVRETHNRFVRMANEHAPLRDITASLKNLLESPETRSYEYAVAVLSSPAPVPTAVRAALIPHARLPRFQNVYPIVAAILLTLLIMAGLLLQTGVIPAAGR